MILFALVSMLSTLSLASPVNRQISPSVSIPLGTVVGKTNAATGIDSFLGIPFAQPPIGNLRFAPPVPITNSFGTITATGYGNNCPQMALLQLPGVLGNITNTIMSSPLLAGIGGGPSGEDCLFLNIQRPAGIAANAALPVMVWIYGGGFESGGSSAYDASALIRRSISNGQPVIVVSLNYRMNSFGFLPGKESAADPTVSVNAGLLDQRLALKFVQTNIAAFGGDPTKVTLFGESSGAISAAFQMLINKGDNEGLFRAVICESGSPIPVQETSHGQPWFDILINYTGCSSAPNAIACLRAVPYTTLLAATNSIPGITSYRSVALAFLPRTDGVVLTDQAENLLAQGLYTKIPFISGDQADEGTILTIGTFNITTDAAFTNYLSTIWFPSATPDQINTMAANYPSNPASGSPFDTGFLNNFTGQNKRISAIVGDFTFQAPRRAFLSYLSKTQPTWSYLSRTGYGTTPLGTYHGSDVSQVFAQGLPSATSLEIQDRWISFANTLSPNTPSRLFWPQYGSNLTLLQFSDYGSKLITDTYRQDQMNYFLGIQSVLAQ